MKPKISVIIPVFNIEKYIKQCVNSVLSKSYIPSEILLINDGSKDESLLICKEYEKKYPSLIKVVDKQRSTATSLIETILSMKVL